MIWYISGLYPRMRVLTNIFAFNSCTNKKTDITFFKLDYTIPIKQVAQIECVKLRGKNWTMISSCGGWKVGGRWVGGLKSNSLTSSCHGGTVKLKNVETNLNKNKRTVLIPLTQNSSMRKWSWVSWDLAAHTLNPQYTTFLCGCQKKICCNKMHIHQCYRSTIKYIENFQ